MNIVLANSLHEAARRYVDIGLSVIALNGKAPNGAIHPHGLKDALSVADFEERAYEAFDHRQTTGVGILTGHPYFVIDIDGEDGAQQWKDLVGEEDYLPDRWMARTGRGLHLWFSDTTPRTTRKLGPKLDLKAAGGYVAAPPSAHPDGHAYEWLQEPLGPPLEAPDALLKLLDEQDWEMERRITAKRANKRVRMAPRPGWFMPSWGFDGVLDKVRAAEEGNRNALLYWAAFTLSEDDADADEFENLYEAALEAGLTRREARLTIRSAQKKAANG